jgi:hypothetical protein
MTDDSLRDQVRKVVKYWMPCTETDEFIDAATDAVMAVFERAADVEAGMP